MASRRAVIVALLAGAGAWLAGLALWGPDRTAPPAAAHALRSGDPAVVARGAVIYQQHCAACHGVQGEGQPNWRDTGPDGLLPAPPHDASGHTWHHPDEQLFALTRDGVAAVIGQPGYRSAMPAFAGTLSDGDIVAVLSWIKAQWPPEVRAHHDAVNAQARAAAR